MIRPSPHAERKAQVNIHDNTKRFPEEARVAQGVTQRLAVQNQAGCPGTAAGEIAEGEDFGNFTAPALHLAIDIFGCRRGSCRPSFLDRCGSVLYPVARLKYDTVQAEQCATQASTYARAPATSRNRSIALQGHLTMDWRRQAVARGRMVFCRHESGICTNHQRPLEKVLEVPSGQTPTDLSRERLH